MATNNTFQVNPYSSSKIDKNLVKSGSVLKEYRQTDSLSFDQQFEGVPTEKLVAGGIRIKKQSYQDARDGIWLGIDKDGKGKINIGDENNFFLWDGENLVISGTITGATVQTAAAGQRIRLSSNPSNAIEFLEDGTVFGLLEVTRDGDDGQVRLVDPYSGNFGVYLESTVGSGSNTVAALRSQGATVTAGGTGTNYNAQLIANGVFFGSYRTGTGTYLLTNGRLASNWLPQAGGQYNLGSSGLRWNDVFAVDILSNFIQASDGANIDGWNVSATLQDHENRITALENA